MMSFNVNETTISYRALKSMPGKILDNVHDHLYNNLYLLTKMYPANKKMEAMLERRMFVKNNKAASQEVLYYLLNIADPKLVQTTITSWPPYDIKQETKFRSELLQCIEEIKSLHQADLPHIMSSHLISPGGFKFAYFIYKLSQFVNYVHLKRTLGENVLRCPKRSKASNRSADLEVIKLLHEPTEAQITSTKQEHEKYHALAQELSKKILDELRSSEKAITKLEEKYKDVKAKFDEKYPSYPSVTKVMESLQKVKTDWDKLNNIHQLFQESNSLISYLTSNDLVLEHNGNNPMGRSKGNKLDLNEYLKSLNEKCENMVVELPNPTSSFLADIKEKVNILIEKSARLEEGLLLNKKQFETIMNEVLKLLPGLLAADTEEI